MSYRIELKNDLAIVQLITRAGKRFQLVRENGLDEEVILQSPNLEEVLHEAEYAQNKIPA